MSGMLKLTQIRSAAGRQAYQRATLRGLGLDKLRRSKTVPDTPSNRGRVEAVKHLLVVETVDGD